MEIVSVNIQKGGCGKTTTVQVLAELLGEQGYKVLCLDTDPQCNLTSASGIDILSTQGRNLYTLLKGTTALEETVIHTKYYDLIPSSLELCYADTEFSRPGKENFLKERLSGAKYDIIFIDTPPSLSLLNIMSLTASTKAIISTEMSYFALIGLNQLSETIDTVKKYSNKKLELMGILPVKYNARTNLNAEVERGLTEMANNINTRVFDSKIRESVKIKEAQLQQVPIIEWCKGLPALEDYKEFCEEIKKYIIL